MNISSYLNPNQNVYDLKQTKINLTDTKNNINHKTAAYTLDISPRGLLHMEQNKDIEIATINKNILVYTKNYQLIQK